MLYPIEEATLTNATIRLRNWTMNSKSQDTYHKGIKPIMKIMSAFKSNKGDTTHWHALALRSRPTLTPYLQKDHSADS